MLRLLAVAALWLAAWTANAQITQMPPTDLTDAAQTGRFVSYPGSLSQTLTELGSIERLPSVAPRDGAPWPDGSGIVEPGCGAPLYQEPPLPPENRSGFFQKVLFDYTYLPRLNASGLGINDIEGKIVFAVPFPTVDWPLLIIPGYGLHLMDGPSGVEMPARLHDAFLAFRWLPKFSETLMLDVTVAPGWFSDFEQSSDEAFRLTGYAAASWACTPAIKWVLGVGYFDRLNVGWLPVGGLIWTPNERVNFEILFPRPKLAVQLPGFGADGRLVQDWAYLAAEFGGGQWAFARGDGVADVVDFSDYRIYLGLERKIRGGLDARIEFGYVFGRKIQYLSGLPTAYPSDTIMARAGLMY